MDLEALLNGVKDGSVSVQEASAKLKIAPYVELGAFAKLVQTLFLRERINDYIIYTVHRTS